MEIFDGILEWLRFVYDMARLAFYMAGLAFCAAALAFLLGVLFLVLLAEDCTGKFFNDGQESAVVAPTDTSYVGDTAWVSDSLSR